MVISKTTLPVGHATKDIMESARYLNSTEGLHKKVSGHCTSSTNTLTAFGPIESPLTTVFGFWQCQRPTATTSFFVLVQSSSLHLFKGIYVGLCQIQKENNLRLLIYRQLFKTKHIECLLVMNCRVYLRINVCMLEVLV